MAEYIEREAVLNRLCQENCDHDYVKDKCQNCYVSAFIEYAPAADVVPVVHGRWEPVKYNAHCSCGKSYGTYHYLCSACEHISYAQPYGLNYCPNCGARMDGDPDG